MSQTFLERNAEFYGITIGEAQHRYDTVSAQAGNPADPICVGCAKRPPELACYLEVLEPGEDATQYVLHEEGTLNTSNGHFLCDWCYIKNGSPSSDRGWKAP